LLKLLCRFKLRKFGVFVLGDKGGDIGRLLRIAKSKELREEPDLLELIELKVANELSVELSVIIREMLDKDGWLLVLLGLEYILLLVELAKVGMVW
jgi:hypothetical protein